MHSNEPRTNLINRVGFITCFVDWGKSDENAVLTIPRNRRRSTNSGGMLLYLGRLRHLGVWGRAEWMAHDPATKNPRPAKALRQPPWFTAIFVAGSRLIKHHMDRIGDIQRLPRTLSGSLCNYHSFFCTRDGGSEIMTSACQGPLRHLKANAIHPIGPCAVRVTVDATNPRQWEGEERLVPPSAALLKGSVDD